MPTTLDAIMDRTRVGVERRRAEASLPQLEAAAAAHVPRGFAAALRAATGPAIIAECKRASPSRGVLRQVYDPAAVARAYQAAGAAAISVLTEPEFFLGSLDDLSAVSAAVTLPVLRKDFMLDEFQMLEARAAGADAILLIVAALSDQHLHRLAASARAIGLDILSEVHDREELARALNLGCHLIGVNCRNLKTLAVDPHVHTELAHSLPDDVVRVAESGIRSAADIARLHGLGYAAFLVGEALITQPDPGHALSDLLGSPSRV